MAEGEDNKTARIERAEIRETTGRMASSADRATQLAERRWRPSAPVPPGCAPGWRRSPASGCRAERRFCAMLIGTL
ncbi:MAG: hypothetical protein KGJ78_04650 [Alphaproteobacteria bacterium]|nr:hypothetical protein [Alphaproteobacteria bacterium]